MRHKRKMRWVITGTSPDKYQGKIHYNIFSKKIKSAELKSISENDINQEFGTILSEISAGDYIGKRICFSATVRAKNVTGRAALWIKICDSTEATIRFNNMKDNAIIGTTSKKYYSSVVDIPADSDTIFIGFILYGQGEIWMDNIEFNIVEKELD